MMQNYTCPNCGSGLRYVPQYQNWYCDNCRIYPFMQQAPAPYPHKPTEKSGTLPWIVAIVIILIAIPIIIGVVYVILDPIPNEHECGTSGALDFSESTQTPGLYTGAFLSLSKSIKIAETSVTITDDSSGNSQSQDPLNPGTTIGTGSGGLNLIYYDSTDNNKIDGGDVIRGYNAASGDIVKFVYKPTGGMIASYCFI
ncbi:MAG: hypothetical protein JSW28_04045 [Thermoplasmata archaeon]|nr:MAG: hypothetical protein JSW28_04045 [Thermoplasmata archaeon]